MPAGGLGARVLWTWRCATEPIVSGSIHARNGSTKLTRVAYQEPTPLGETRPDSKIWYIRERRLSPGSAGLQHGPHSVHAQHRGVLGFRAQAAYRVLDVRRPQRGDFLRRFAA